ncbi:MAG: hypothetical protein AB7H80_16250 [Candidatus Kapaibacterium sp.]
MASNLSAQEVQIKDILWKGNDFIVQFSDSLDYEVDLVETDSSNIVIRLSSPLSTEERSIENSSKGLKATLSRSAAGGMQVLTIRGNKRFGYSTLWLPYSHRLIVHTFESWDKLSFAEGEYHRGLNALELNTPDVAERSLSQVIATDKGELSHQASSILGILYAREGKDSLARTYLKAPRGADDYMALAEIARRAGDSLEAAKNEQLFAENLQRHPESATSGDSSNQGTADEVKLEPAQSNSRHIGDLLKSWKGLLLIGLVALVVIGLAIWFARKPEESKKEPQEEKKRPEEEAIHTPFVREEPTSLSERNPDNANVTSERREADDSAIMHLEIPPVPEPEKPIESDPAPPTELPKPDAEPPSPNEDVAVLSSESDSIKEKNNQGSRASSQADQLRQKMAATSAESSGVQRREGKGGAESTDDATTISEARKLNVSRDYVELRNRIADLRKKIEEKK